MTCCSCCSSTLLILLVMGYMLKSYLMPALSMTGLVSDEMMEAVNQMQPDQPSKAGGTLELKIGDAQTPEVGKANLGNVDDMVSKKVQDKIAAEAAKMQEMNAKDQEA